MRVLFVSPAKLYPVNKSGKPIQQIRQNVSLPALIILSNLKSKGFDIDFMDLLADGYNNRVRINKYICRVGLADEAVVDRINKIKPNVLMVTSMFSTEQKMVDDLTTKVKKADPNLPIIVGGIHASAKPEWILKSGNVDFVVIGGGEDTIYGLLRSLKNGNPEKVEGIAYKKNGKIIINKRRRIKSDFNSNFEFDKILLKEDKYRYVHKFSRRSKVYSHLSKKSWEGGSFCLFYSKGCPFHCKHCVTSERDGMVIRHIGSKQMFNDFKVLHERYGVQFFYNQADTFGFHPEDIKFLRLLKEYRKKHPDFIINNPNGFFIRIFFPSSKNYELDKELLDLFAEAGFNVMTYSIETFNRRFNKKIDFKKISAEKIRLLLKETQKRGMKIEVYMMYAFPEQTLKELAYDEVLVKTYVLPYTDVITWQSLMIFPGTEYYRIGLKKGWFTEESYRKTLSEGYFFHHLPDTFNFSKMPPHKIREFEGRNPLIF